MIKVGIIGGAGYTAGELIRILVNHPDARIVFVHSESNAGNAITHVHDGFDDDFDLFFYCDMVFLLVLWKKTRFLNMLRSSI